MEFLVGKKKYIKVLNNKNEKFRNTETNTIGIFNF